MINLSKYILLLQSILDEHGDIPVVKYYSEYGDWYGIYDPELVLNISVQSNHTSIHLDKAVQVC